MVQMYVWLVVAVVLAVGVLALAYAATRRDGSVSGDDAPRTLAAAAHQTWTDFRSGLSTLRSRLARVGRASGSGPAGARQGRPGAGGAGTPARVPVLAGARPASVRGDDGRRGMDAWSFETPQDTTIDDFFSATQTSEPAYLDTAQMSDLLHLRR